MSPQSERSDKQPLKSLSAPVIPVPNGVDRGTLGTRVTNNTLPNYLGRYLVPSGRYWLGVGTTFRKVASTTSSRLATRLARTNWSEYYSSSGLRKTGRHPSQNTVLNRQNVDLQKQAKTKNRQI